MILFILAFSVLLMVWFIQAIFVLRMVWFMQAFYVLYKIWFTLAIFVLRKIWFRLAISVLRMVWVYLDHFCANISLHDHTLSHYDCSIIADLLETRGDLTKMSYLGLLILSIKNSDSNYQYLCVFIASDTLSPSSKIRTYGGCSTWS
jgi:hypothetical protein